MRLVRMNGGLGNQIFQYIFLRYVEIKTGEDCIVDDSEFYHLPDEIKNNPVYNGYQIERIFGIKKKRLSGMFDKDTFSDLVNLASSPAAEGEKRRGLIPAFKESGVDLFVVQEGTIYEYECQNHGNTFSTPMNEFYPDVANFKGEIYYYGYWINAQWLASIANNIIAELQFPELTDEKNKEYMKKIKAADTNSVAFHIRRGDFVTVGWALDSSIYSQMISQIRAQIKEPVFFVFSDDIQWVKGHSEELGLRSSDDITYVEGNFRETSYIDMQLMKECRGMVFPGSSFSYLAALLNTRKDKIVFQPTNRKIIYYN